jgi:hypothetical protein
MGVWCGTAGLPSQVLLSIISIPHDVLTEHHIRSRDLRINVSYINMLEGDAARAVAGHAKCHAAFYNL